MGKRIDQFCEALHVKLTAVDKGLENIKTGIRGKAEHAELSVRDHLEQVHERIDQDRAKVASAKARAARWVEQRKAATSEQIAEWKGNHELARLQARADDCELYAEAAIAIAVNALDEAEAAVAEAYLARADADFAKDMRTAA